MPADSVHSPFDLRALVERLRRAGFRIDTRQYLVAHELLLAIANQKDFDKPERLTSHLGPIFCTSGEEQERFRGEVLQWLDKEPPVSPQDPGPDKSQLRATRRHRFRTAVALGLTAVIIVLALWVWRSRPQTTPPAESLPSPAEVVTAPPAIEPPPQTAWLTVALGAALVTGLAFGVVWLIDRGRRQLALRRLPTSHDPERVRLPVPEIAVRLVADSALRRAAAALSRPREGTILEFDVEATVDESARAGGFFTPRFSARRSAQEYVALVNRRGSDDHQAAVFDTFLRQLRERGIALETYSFHDDPGVCYSDESGQGRRLSEVVSRHHQATLLVCGEAHVAFTGRGGTLARWIETTTPLDRRVFWTPEAPYRWSRLESDLVEAGFTVIPATEEGWRALIDLENGWRQEALYPAPYARPFPGLIGANDRRWLDRNQPPADIVDKLVRQVTEFLGPTGFRWLCACAVYPEITWGLTLRLAGDAPDYQSLPSLSRLPWFRHGFMPDWLRRLLVSRLGPEAGDRLRTNLERLVEDLAGPSRTPTNTVVRSALTIGRWMGSIGTVHVLRAAPEGSPLRDQVFLGFMARANVDPLSLRVSGAVARLFPGRVGRFARGLQAGHQAESLARQLAGRLRAWAVFHPERFRLGQAMGLGLVLLMFWRPAQIPSPSSAIPSAAPDAGAIPQTSNAPNPAPGALSVETDPAAMPASPAATVAQPQAAPSRETARGTGDTSVAQRNPPSGSGQPQPQAFRRVAPIQTAPQPPVGPSVPETTPETGVGGAAPPAERVPVAVPEAVSAGRGGQPGPAEAAAAPSAQVPDNNVSAITQVLQNYSAALMSLKPEAVQALYPSVNVGALRRAFADYTSLNHQITIDKIELSPDGQRAGVMAVVSTSPVVRTGRAQPTSRMVTFSLRKQGNAWVIENAK